ncbi:MAG: cyclodeaminase/cyclohydrolase family protein [Deltaproteobacteria bacterium]|nr:cyclodeaminase/cyclohydrolase family protein [Deltaproteobacteria bacterium]
MKFDEKTFLEILKEPRPDPGGGAACAYVGLVATVLAEKICSIEVTRAIKNGHDHKHLDSLLEHVKSRSKIFRLLIERDITAYAMLANSVRNGLRWPENYEIVLEAILCPSDIISCAIASMALISDIGHSCGRRLVPDLMVALEFVHTVVAASCHIAEANLKHVEEPGVRESQKAQLHELVRKAGRHYSRILDSFKRLCLDKDC